MSTLGDLFGFEKFQLGSWWKKIRKHPEQLLLGAAEPVGAKLWGGITGKKYEPLVDEWGGPTESTFDQARASGINTGVGRSVHDAAHTIAALYAMNYGAGKLPQGDAGGFQAPNLPQPDVPERQTAYGTSMDAYLERERLKKALRDAIARQAAEASSMAPQPRLVM